MNNKLSYGNKAKNLEYVAKNTDIEIPYFKEIYLNDLNNIENIIDSFSQKIMIRSNSSSEDKEYSSSAGKYLSIGPIDRNDLETIKKSWEMVVGSYEEQDNQSVIFQNYIENAKSVSVLTSYKVGSDSAYRTFSTYYGSETDAITSGKYSEINNFFMHRSFDILPKKYEKYNVYLKIITQLEDLFKNKQLDIEMVLDKNNSPQLLQVRPLMGKKLNKESIFEEKDVIDRNLKNYKKLNKTTADRFGTNQIYSNMSDMNPAEMIGKKPDNIAFGLYKFMFTDTTWNIQRGEFGYRKYSGGKLMELFNNVAYINVNHSLNSFLTRSLQKESCEEIINYQLNKLKENPHLHDSIEFDISRSSYVFDTVEEFSKEYKDIISPSEIIKWHNDLIQIDTQNKSTLEKNKKIILSTFSKLDKSFEYSKKENIKLIRDTMALPFTHHSRLGFVYFAQLNSLLEKEVISEDQKKLLLLSVNSISTKMKADAYEVKIGKKTLEGFLDVYGHIRAGNYNLLSSNLKNNLNFTESLVNNSEQPLQDNILPKDIYTNIEEYFTINETPLKASAWIDMFQEGISTRENSKFYYTKGIDGILNEVGEKNTSDRELFDLLDIEFNEENTSDMRLKNVLMPDLITSNEDFYFYEEMSKNGNYIGQGTVIGDVLLIDNEANRPNNLENKIVVIPAADPGWDWIFNYKIKSLVTKYGGPNSHMAIRCAEHNIPAILGVGENNFTVISNSKSLKIDFSNEGFSNV
ncbi:PEP-utilizing enzyme [Acidimicrobiaceae bacterium]|nr:PEP-utilizing enzyme [Acidimicrobiaceae bacterium]